MSDSAAEFVGSIPEEYDRGLGPVIFIDYAESLAARVASFGPKRVLETAAGSGIVSHCLRVHLSPDAVLTVTDLNPPMLDVARRKFDRADRVEFQSADATDLPFSNDLYDAVVCQFGVMFFPDKDRSYREVHRVLRPGGRYHFSVWDAHLYNPFGRLMHEVVGSFFPSDPPQFYKVPFGYSGIDPIKESLIEAGFSSIRIDVVTSEKQIGDLASFARGLVFGNPLIGQILSRGGVGPESIAEAMKLALEREFPNGAMPLQAIIFEATKTPKIER